MQIRFTEVYMAEICVIQTRLYEPGSSAVYPAGACELEVCACEDCSVQIGLMANDDAKIESCSAEIYRKRTVNLSITHKSRRIRLGL